jgi:hypothetical protein
MHEFWILLQSIPWFAWIAIVAIISSGAVQIVTASHRHAERIELIRQGIHPDGGKAVEREV